MKIYASVVSSHSAASLKTWAGDVRTNDGRLTELSRPSVRSIMKKIRDQNVEPGSVAMASGYTTNTRPGPGNTPR